MNKELIVITGASSGIGMATAKAFQEKGHPLLLLARRLDKFKSMESKTVLCKPVDVTDYESFKKAVHEAESKLGPVGCLINNAGVMLLGSMMDQSPAEWKQMFDVNVMGVLNGIQIVLPSMTARKKGTIINISSIAGRFAFPNHAAYCGTKFAVHGISETVRKEVLKDNIRVAIVAPGAVETELLGHTTSKEIISGYEDWKKEIGGALNVEAIVKAILYVYEQPQNVCVREVMVGATRQEP